MASRLANTEDSISHMDSKTPVLDVGSYERLLSMEASLAALSDSSPGMAERRRSAVQSLKRPSIPNVARDKPEWLLSVPPRLQTIENSMAETLERLECTFTSLPRTDDALQSGLFRVGRLCWAIHYCWRRCWDVCNSS